MHIAKFSLNQLTFIFQNPTVKPPYSYANLITFAINSSDKRKITLSEIYSWILHHFPYYKGAGNGWKVSYC